MPSKWMLRLFSTIHVFLYRLFGGAIGARMNGLPVLLLTTTGRKTGKPRTKPLVYLRDGADYIIAPGILARPDWYLNLQLQPNATIRVGQAKYVISAEEAADETYSKLWELAPPYWHDYRRNYPGQMPLVILRPNVTLNEKVER